MGEDFNWLVESKEDRSMKTINLKYSVEKPNLDKGLEKHYNSVVVPGLSNSNIPGEPSVPFKTASILIPYGYEIKEIKVVPGKEEYLGNAYIEPGQEPVPVGQIKRSFADEELTPPDERIYASEEPFPREVYSVAGIQNKKGYKILYLNLYPVRYIPKTNDVYYFDKFNVAVKTVAQRKLDSGSFRDLPQDRNEVSKMVDNPEHISTYVSDLKLTESSPLLDGQYDYVIITSQALRDAPGPHNFTALASWKNSKGINSTIVTVEDIYTNYPGMDNQTQIRNFIRDAYQNNSLEYVLLGGDADGADVGGESGDNIVPVRGLWAANSECNPPNIASDLYYACLDGDYDYNGNGIYGERYDGINGGDVDLLAEVYVGRAPVDSPEEMNNFVMKVIDYESSSEDPYINEVWMVGEYLGFGGISDWGGNMKDEIKDDSCANGYCTVGFPNDYSKSTLYDRDYSGNNWPKSELISIINSNIHTINHDGHGSPDVVLKMSCDDVDALYNNKYFFGYSQACYSGSFDNRDFDTTCGYLDSDCILEHFVTSPTGAFAFIGNSRYGWGYRYSTDGSSQRFDRQFWDAIFGEGIVNIGRANQDSKEDNLGSIYERNSMRFCYYEINLLGDPETPYLSPTSLEHDIEVTSMTLPAHLKVGEIAEISSVVSNKGSNDESNVEVQLLENGDFLESQTIPLLSIGGSTYVNFTWSKDSEGDYSITVYAVPLVGEDYTSNNQKSKSISVSGTDILLVDDDKGKIYETYYENALSANGYDYEKIVGSPTLDDLNRFKCVIWFTGDDYQTSLTTGDQANLAAYLDEGGRLFISGQDIGYDIRSSAFYSNYLNAQYARDDTNVYTLEGVSGDSISDGLTISITGGDGAGNQIYQSEISPINDAVPIFNYLGDGCGALRAYTETYKVIYFSFGFEAINDASDRNELMGRIISELCGGYNYKYSMYYPNFTDTSIPESWCSQLVLQNLANSEANIYIELRSGSGDMLYEGNDTIAARGVKALSPKTLATFDCNGSATVKSDQVLMGICTINSNDNDMGMSYEAFNESKTDLILPYVTDTDDSAGSTTWMIFQNPSDTESDVDIGLTSESGALSYTDSITIPACGSTAIRPKSIVGSDFVGSAVVTSNQPITGVCYIIGNNNEMSMSYSAFT
ncbi:MAG TPA: hypothetical protein HA349_06825 [Methanotrichaceae archaeon]|nr:hypothetical protein [Methanotrichaceae archaeon]